MKKFIKRLWEEAGWEAGHAAIERQFDGCPKKENDKQFRRDRRRTFVRLLGRELIARTVCRVRGCDTVIEEEGDAESGPIIYWHCRRCGKCGKGSW